MTRAEKLYREGNNNKSNTYPEPAKKGAKRAYGERLLSTTTVSLFPRFARSFAGSGQVLVFDICTFAVRLFGPERVP